MRERDVFDLLLVAAVGVAAYVQAFGMADPIATFDELVTTLAAVDEGVYLVLGGVVGIFFVGYLVLYLPKKDAGRAPR
ncbi:hypothetical protein [Halomicrobium urmianum]|uniref:hypothetical protein n=1 Tax=Halomicrobium urmianum TaxID=1586233 RepID=UPI001CD9DEBC|nr:hypothetical protein [Halomicrobium urmianum]